MPYQALYQIYGESKEPARLAQAQRVLRAWLSADPSSVGARLLHFQTLQQASNFRDAEVVLSTLFHDAPDNPAVLGAMSEYYRGREQELLARLEDERARHPDNLALVMQLVAQYRGAQRSADATRVLDEMRRAVAGDAEQLFPLAELYQELGQGPAAESVLREVIRLDPRNAMANNHLGYMLADAGKNLPEAEAMIRIAVAAEPDNYAYLDSLGWALYKRGQFEEARRNLAQAAQGATPDAVVLDHLADVLYRLNRGDEAAKLWQQSLDRVAQGSGQRDDLDKLKVQLKRKLEQHKAAQPVHVAPVVESPTQAKQ